MTADDVPKVIGAGTRAHASLYNNIFGGNLPEGRRGNSIIFEYLERFQIGQETTNRFDNILIFGESHEFLQEQFNRLVAADTFYGADSAYMGARRDYIEGGDDNVDTATRFLDMLVSQRRALFFRVPEDEKAEIGGMVGPVFRHGKLGEREAARAVEGAGQAVFVRVQVGVLIPIGPTKTEDQADEDEANEK